MKKLMPELNEEDAEKLLVMSDEISEMDLVKWVAEPRPEGFGLKVSKSTMHRWLGDLRAKRVLERGEEMKEQARAMVDTAIVNGRVLPNQREFWRVELERNFEEKSVVLANCGSVMKVERREEGFMSRTRGANGGKERQSKVQALVNAKRTNEGLNYDQAWAAVKSENPELFQ